MLALILSAVALSACASTASARGTGEALFARHWGLHRHEGRGRSLLQAAPAPAGDIPKQCLDSGINLQSACSAEINKASAYFGVSNSAAGLGTASAKVDQARLEKYVNDPSTDPSPGCCKAAAVFNSNRCSCDKNVLDLVKSFTSNDISLYGRISEALARNCNFNLLYDTSC